MGDWRDEGYYLLPRPHQFDFNVRVVPSPMVSIGGGEKRLRTILGTTILRKCLQILPWGVAGGILYWLFTLYPPEQIWASMKLANLWAFGILAVIYLLLIWLTDVFGVTMLLRRFVEPISMRTVLCIRAATYPVSLINYGAGQAGFAYYLQRIRKIPAGQIIGVFTLITAVDLFWVVSLAFFGSFIGEHVILGVDVVPTVRLIGYIVYGATALHLIFWLMHWEDRVRGKLWQRIFGWLRAKKLFRIFHEATFRDYVRLFLWRAPMHTMIILSIYIAIHFFHGSIPLTAALGNIPISVLIGVIPISWSGVGTSNKALVDLLSPHISAAPIDAGLVTAGELILAFSILWMLSNFIGKLLLGFYYLPRVQRAARTAKQKKTD